MTFYLAALLASLCWSISGILSKKPAEFYGSVRFNRIRLTFIWVLFGVWLTAAGRITDIQPDHLVLSLLSGLVGIYIGDTALFNAYNRLGPRRTSILFAVSSPFTVLLALIVYGELPPAKAVAGVAVVFIGCVLAIVFGTNKKNPHEWDAVKGKLSVALLLGLLAALGQAGGIILIKPAMEQGLDPFIGTFYRISISVVMLHMQKLTGIYKPSGPHEKGVFWRACFCGFIGLGVGMTLVMYALEGGHSGIVATLSSLSPVLILPIIALITRRNFPLGAWVGAVLVVGGVGLVFFE